MCLWETQMPSEFASDSSGSALAEERCTVSCTLCLVLVPGVKLDLIKRTGAAANESAHAPRWSSSQHTTRSEHRWRFPRSSRGPRLWVSIGARASARVAGATPR